MNTNDLTPEQMRVLVAEDVIYELEIQKYRASTGNYICDIEWKVPDDAYENFTKDIKDNFDAFDSCKVCALGALILSLTKFKNQLTFEDTLRDGFTGSKQTQSVQKVRNLLLGVFEAEQVALIEVAFEYYHYGDFTIYAADKLNAIRDIEKEHLAIEFGSQYPISDSERLKAIMQNIIDNNGEFKP